MIFYAKLKTDQSEPYSFKSHNRYAAGLFVAHGMTGGAVEGAKILVWSEREWIEQQEPREYTVTRVDFSGELKLI